MWRRWFLAGCEQIANPIIQKVYQAGAGGAAGGAPEDDEDLDDEDSDEL